jgi:DNA-directed RNA polymerase specialized sigma24 family protein
LRAAVFSLKPTQRAVLVLLYYADHTIGEIAQALGKTEGHVRCLARDGERELKRLLWDRS